MAYSNTLETKKKQKDKTWSFYVYFVNVLNLKTQRASGQ